MTIRVMEPRYIVVGLFGVGLVLLYAVQLLREILEELREIHVVLKASPWWIAKVEAARAQREAGR